VPINIVGTRKIFPKGSYLPRLAKGKLVIGEPVLFTDESPKERTAFLENAVLNLSKQ
jgi:1-acyl-sn-glycerol-3-phosphate acyltransferase